MLKIESAGIRAVRIDARRARVGFARRRLSVYTVSDARLHVHLARLPRARGLLFLDGRRVRAVRTKRRALGFTVPAGHHTLMLVPRHALTRAGGARPR